MYYSISASRKGSLLLAISIFICTLLGSMKQTAAQSGWTDYQRINGSNGNVVDIAYRKGTFDYGSGERQFSFKVYNPYNRTIKVVIKVQYEEGNGDESYMKIYATLAPHDTDQSSGNYTICRRILSYTIEEFQYR